MIKLFIHHWVSHLNMFLYSFHYYSKFIEKDYEIVLDRNVPWNAAVMTINSKSFFFDYSDDISFLSIPSNYDVYFKRSLSKNDILTYNNVYALNFQINISHEISSFLFRQRHKFLFHRLNKTEFIRAIDFLGLITYNNHNSMTLVEFKKKSRYQKYDVSFVTRLWDPEKSSNQNEKSRRVIQNEFRIKACEIIKKNFSNVNVGIADSYLANKTCPSHLIISNSQTKKSKYLKALKSSLICVADDGLKNTPGWKIGEYTLLGKAIVTTPINITVDEFLENNNFLSLSSRSSFDEIPAKVDYLLSENRFYKMSQNNLVWSDKFLNPKNYLINLLKKSGYEF